MFYQTLNSTGRTKSGDTKTLDFALKTNFKPFRRWLFLCLFLFGAVLSGAAQIGNVTAWNFGGQIWIKWEHLNPGPNQIGYRIYSLDAAQPYSTNWNDWTEIGSVFIDDAIGRRMRDFNPLITGQRKLRYFDANGNIVPLTDDERLFVATPHQDSKRYYAVRRVRRVETGPTTCYIEDEPGSIPNGNVTSGYLTTIFDPNLDIQPVLQKEADFDTEIKNPDGTKRNATFNYRIYGYWVDGRDDHTSGRNDYPVMGSRSRNGVPFFFVIWEPEYGLPDHYGAVHFLHGGGGKASKFRPGNGYGIDLVPEKCYLVSHDDDNLLTLGGDCRPQARHTWWFGYASLYDAFLHTYQNQSLQNGDSVINFTQRRVMWVNDWLKGYGGNGFEDEEVAIMGFSLGSHGVNHIARTFPNDFSTATLFSFNPKEGTPNSWTMTGLGFGNSANVETNLRDHTGSAVTMDKIWNYKFQIAPERDFPIMRHFHGRNDANNLEGWDANLVTEVTDMDATGWGLNFFWDGRGHACRTPNSYFSKQNYSFNLKTVQTDLLWQMDFRRNESYPGFYNFDADPGPDRSPSIEDLSVGGDAVGSWGGFIGWDTVIENPSNWIVDAFLIRNEPGYSDKDTSLYDCATTYLTVRKPQYFTPAPGSVVHGRVTNLTTGFTVTGSLTLGADGLIRLEWPIPLCKDQVTRIHFSTSPVPPVTKTNVIPDSPEGEDAFLAYPNPVQGNQLSLKIPDAGGAVRLLDLTGRVLATWPQLTGNSTHTIDLPKGLHGLYLIEFQSRGHQHSLQKILVP